MTFRLVLVSSLLVFCSCRSPTSSSRAFFSGRWVGTYQADRCVAVGFPPCGEHAGSAHAIEVTLSENSGAISGTLRIDEASMMSVDVTGSAAGGTALTLTGHGLQQPVTSLSADTLDVLQWATTRGGADAMTGRFSFRRASTWGLAASPYYPPGETWSRTYDASVELTRR